MPGPTDEKPVRPWGAGRILAVLVAIGLALFWIWIFAGGPKKQNPDYLNDRAWATRAEQACSSAQSAIAALPGAETTPDHVQRARVVDQGSDRIEAMIDRLDKAPPSNSTDMKLVDQWTDDYRSYLASRRDYAARLRTDRTARLLLDEKFRQPIDDVIATFAEVNNIPACKPPGDVG